MALSVGILTVSDRCSRGEAEDVSGKILEKLVLAKGWKVEPRAVVPDEVRQIKAVLEDWCTENRMDLILTTGGTGLGPRDVTPEATREIIEKELPGLGELMRADTLKKSPMAALSRATAGSRRKTLIVNFPGSPKGAQECLEAVADVLEHGVAMIHGGGHEHHHGRART